MCLDIGSALLSESWVWEINIEQEDATCANAGTLLLRTIVERCGDIAATVRTRAIGALDDLLDSVSNSVSSGNVMHQNMQSSIHILAMGTTKKDSGTCSNVPLFDTLRELTRDDKPLVRAKAIKALGKLSVIVASDI